MKTNTIYTLLALVIVGIVSSIVFVDNLQKNRDKGNSSGPPSKIVEISPHYVEYSEASLVKAKSAGRAVIYFWAVWCPTCQALDKELKERSQELPDDVTILKTNYDTEKELKKKYQIIQQHTLVQMDKNGNEVKKWIGGNIDVIKEQLK